MFRVPGTVDFMPTSDDYRRKAEECRQLAKQATDKIERTSLLRMATEYDQLAKRMAEIEVRQGRAR
jgi:hypothetical protein